nr:hypothetical protein [Tanacetum cinerariifolium]
MIINGQIKNATTPIHEDGENATVEQIKKRAKWDDDDYVCRGLILKGPYTPSIVIILAVPATNDSLEQKAVETILNMSPKNKEHYQSEKEAIHLLLSRMGDEIYSTIDACKIAHDIWIVIERLQQAKPITPPSESASEEDSDLEQAQRDKDMQKNLALISKYFKKIYKPTNNNLITSLNSKNKNVDTSLSQEVQHTRIQCFNYKEFGHFAKECRKPKRVKDYTYHKKRYKEIDEKELEAHYSYMEKIHEVPIADSRTDTEPLEHVQYDVKYNVFANERQHSKQSKSINNTCVLEKVNSNVIPNSSDMCNNDIQTDQNAKECDDERVALANLI